MRIPRAICGHCSCEMLIWKTGTLTEMFTDFGPYYKIYGDTYRCPKCEHHVTLLADKAVTEHFRDNYGLYHEDFQATFSDHSAEAGAGDGER